MMSSRSYFRFLCHGCACIALLSPIAAKAQAVVQAQPKIVVTANRYAQPASQVGSSITVISASEIEQRQLRTLAEALRTVPGVDVAQNGGRGKVASVFLRGTESSHVLVLVDGVELNDPSNTTSFYDFAHFTTDNVERIEVLRGSQGTLYGSEAIGGVIHIFTKEGKGKLSGAVTAEAGSYHTFQESASIQGASQRVRFSAQASRVDSDGFSSFNEERGGREDDPYDNTTLSARAGVDLTENVDANVSLRYTDAEADYDGFGADAASVGSTRQLALRADAGLYLMDDAWEQRLGVSHMDIAREDTTSFGRTDYDGQRTAIDWVHTVRPNTAHTVVVGLETQEEEFDSTFDSQQSVRNNAIYAQDTVQVTEQFNTTFGVRVDDHDAFGTEATYRVVPVYHVENTGTQLSASYGTGFRAPSLFQLYSAFGDPTLQPETSKSWDVGVEQALWDDRARFGLTWFNTDIDDFIDFSFATSRYSNQGDITAEGLEAFVEVTPLPRLSLLASYTFTNAEDKQSGLEPLRRPRHKANLRVAYAYNDAGEVNGTLRYVGEREDTDTNFMRTTMDSYVTLDLATSYDVHEQVKLFGRVDNLFDEAYEEVFSYGTAGLSAYGGARVQF